MEIQIQGGAMRYIYGIVARLGMQGQNHRRYACKARLSPWLWLAKRRSDFRILQNQTVPDIIEQVLGVYGHPLRKKRTRGYRSGDCCAQFNESDCGLVPRWMQHQGIYFFFEHASHGALPGDESIPFHPPGKAGAGDPQNIHARQLEQEIKPGRHCSDGPEVARAGMARTYR